ncbi:unnamed protein product [Phytophthora fragariaefolia]|uniref:DNA 3'-5' helicase n=1 Tax=Phytophthora fragariaefolia TaxID=1490495 RepID=A0A9W6XVD0_9STRA|nr:unnamed protein product [Phytophthora fragariaefolia]
MSSVYLLSSDSVQKTLLTATLPPTWEKVLMVTFGFPFATVRPPTVRPRTRYEVLEVPSAADMLKQCLKIAKTFLEHPDKGIIFALTRPKVEEVAAYLIRHTGKKIARYHSGMSTDERTENFELWKSESCSYIVATCGLGQVVDYPRVRTVIHFGPAHSLTYYAQETGRSGRDGKQAKCITIYCEPYFQQFT